VIYQNNYLALLLMFKIRNLEFGIVRLNIPKFYATQCNSNFNTINTAYLVVLEESKLLHSLQPNFNTFIMSIIFFTEYILFITELMKSAQICYSIANNEATHSAVLSPVIQNTPCTMNVPNILAQCAMNVRLELLQKFKIKNMLTFCVRPNHNIIVMKCIIKYVLYDPQKFLKHGYKPLV